MSTELVVGIGSRVSPDHMISYKPSAQANLQSRRFGIESKDKEGFR